MGMRVPGWVGGLVEESFFVGCEAHESRRKNEKNIFCLACCTSICPHCAPAHRHHPLLQVRRYVYNDVVRLGELEKLIDCSYVQPYTINSAKVIFLKPRPQSRPFKGSGNVCLTCDRILSPSTFAASPARWTMWWSREGTCPISCCIAPATSSLSRASRTSTSATVTRGRSRPTPSLRTRCTTATGTVAAAAGPATMPATATATAMAAAASRRW
ncbi:hypothetical protein VPH35_104146 [Triticum aestivum]